MACPSLTQQHGRAGAHRLREELYSGAATPSSDDLTCTPGARGAASGSARRAGARNGRGIVSHDSRAGGRPRALLMLISDELALDPPLLLEAPGASGSCGASSGHAQHMAGKTACSAPRRGRWAGRARRAARKAAQVAAAAACAPGRRGARLHATFCTEHTPATASGALKPAWRPRRPARALAAPTLRVRSAKLATAAERRRLC
jgi:hypothetical protein